ncbi:carboxypeptidase regulatory-like domain-containing protein [Mucilaginibacter sp. dw_454]|uniref:TonB-dependent receptor n=1 Tax=Mucilaginibacter sp. dw_454 TaxID=2720079 RepID=UPI001BD3796D|nr:carboxypeptidase regulatory-like domain-containing protein [Mucilaginibacter sp. dw_454]
MKKVLLFILLVTGALFTIANKVNAQGVTTASINGTVTDEKETVPGATVTITHVPTGTVYSTSTRADGRFNLNNLRVGGPYIFKVSFIGYKDFTVEGISLTIGQDQNIKVKLETSTATLNEVTVTGTGNKVINSSRTGARETISRTQIDNLPTINRSLQDFTKLTPSATPNGLNFGGRSSTYNNVTVDGALFNNSFGLSGTLGGQTSSQPISLDAIEQIQVDLAPYDVRQGNFTGAGINTAVKSGTNEVKGTVYDYIRSKGLQGYQTGTAGVAKTPFTYRQTGLSVGGPIIKNKLFLFVSGEQERISAPATAYVATAPGVSGSQVSQAKASDLDAISTYLKGLGYDEGAYQGYAYKTSSDKMTVKLDWNVDKNNTISAKYFYLKSFKDQPASNSGIVGISNTTRAPGTTTLPFYGSGYRINNNFNIGIVEWDSRISNTMSNKLTVGYQALRDYRASLGATIPMADIGNGSATTTASAVETSVGYELYTAGNLLNTNIWQFNDDFTIFAGKHEFTFGTSDQGQSYLNGFAPDYNGLYTFNSAADFTSGAAATAYTTRFSALPGGQFPYAKIKANTYAVYAEDKVHLTDQFRLTYGVRADYNVFPTQLGYNANVPALTFQGGTHVDPSKLPKNRLQISPRVGFNWDVNGDQTTQVRGGSGLFTGQVPFVWISNQASNNGLLFGSYTITKGAAGNTPAQNAQLIYNPNVNANRPAVAAANTSYELDVADPNLKYPKIWRTNVAIDQKLPGGVIGTIEGAYTKDINAIYHQNLVLSNTTTTAPGDEHQLIYTSKNTTPAASAATLANPSISGLYYMRNTNQGYSWFTTAQLQKSFSNGLFASAAYTHTVSKDVNDGGSTASTIWSTRYVAGNPNLDNLSNSSFVMPNRVIATLAYKKEYAKNYASTIGLEFEAANSGAVSYITSGDPNNDGATNDLMFIPSYKGQINLVKADANDPRTPDQIWTQLNNFINQDPYLSKHKGEYAQRNGVILPYFKRVDLHLAQDFFVKSGDGKRNTIEVTFDIINFGNMLNRDWGQYYTSFTGFNNGSSTVLKYMGTKDANGKLNYTFPYLDNANQVPLTSSFKTDLSIFSRWQAQVGLRYIFN